MRVFEVLRKFLPTRQTGDALPAFANYLIFLALAGVLLVVFFVIYTRVTPYDEVLLIRQGNAAASLSLGGALIGFSLTIVSAILHTVHPLQFAAWAIGAMVVQLAAYLITTRCMAMSREHIESGNAAYGGLLAAIAVSVGAINAACIS